MDNTEVFIKKGTEEYKETRNAFIIASLKALFFTVLGFFMWALDISFAESSEHLSSLFSIMSVASFIIGLISSLSFIFHIALLLMLITGRMSISKYVPESEIVDAYKIQYPNYEYVYTVKLPNPSISLRREKELLQKNEVTYIDVIHTDFPKTTAEFNTAFIFSELNEAKAARNVLSANDIECFRVQKYDKEGNIVEIA